MLSNPGYNRNANCIAKASESLCTIYSDRILIRNALQTGIFSWRHGAHSHGTFSYSNQELLGTAAYSGA